MRVLGVVPKRGGLSLAHALSLAPDGRVAIAVAYLVNHLAWGRRLINGRRSGDGVSLNLPVDAPGSVIAPVFHAIDRLG
jgi:hypothetical protein